MKLYSIDQTKFTAGGLASFNQSTAWLTVKEARRILRRWRLNPKGEITVMWRV